jgi:hypothetical protein
MRINSTTRRTLKLIFLIGIGALISLIGFEVFLRLDYYLVSRNNKYALAERERWAHTWNVWTPQFWEKKS